MPSSSKKGGRRFLGVVSINGILDHIQGAKDNSMNAHAIFGLNPMWLSGIILVIVYIILILEKLNRAVIALFGAMLMIYCGLLNQEQALRAVDFNTLWLLTGMMMMVNITAKTGVFNMLPSARRSGCAPTLSASC